MFTPSDADVPESGDDPASPPNPDPPAPPHAVPPPPEALQGSLGVLTLVGIGLFTLALFYTLYAARAFFLPVVLAVLLDRLLSPVVRFLRRLRVPVGLGAGLVLLAGLGTTITGLYYASGPATEWLARAPQNLQEAERKLRAVMGPVEKLQQAAEEVEDATQVEDPGAPRVELEKPTLGETIMGRTQSFLFGALVTIFLLYFLLAAGDLFLQKLVQLLPRLRDKKKAVEIARGMERDLSTYLFTVTVINAGLGLVVGFALFLLGMPNPVLWGIMVAVLNFIPYLGPVIGVAVLGLVALVSFEHVSTALLAPAAYFIINAIEGYLVTPLIMGRRLTMNPVAIFISLTFWGWIWGIPGALMAVPLLVAFKVFCDNVDALRPVGAFLGD